MFAKNLLVNAVSGALRSSNLDYKMERKILVSVTTTRGSDWRAKLKEIKKLGLEEVALFPTCLKPEERKEFYRLVEKSGVKSAPLVHIRQDMLLKELDYLIEKYHSKVFCTHMQIEYPLIYDYSNYKKMIYIEGVYHPLDEQELKDFAGICLDLTHLENYRLLYKDIFEHDVKILEKYPIGANHISVIKPFFHIDEDGYKRYDKHHLGDFSELDYLKKYPKNYFSQYIAVELENSLSEQLKIKDYIAKLIK